jgi:2-amino-4-hydroxy-6-hydroxymethyldihydropteridine diphosphokinase
VSRLPVTRFAIGLGSNLGDRLVHLSEASRAIEAGLGPIVISSLYETEPVGGPEQGPYLNAVALVETDTPPEEVLDLLQTIEKSHGRERSVHWGPRTLDLDIIATDASPVDSSRLTVPHPRATEREFVLRPLVEVWPEATLGNGVTALSALSAIGGQGVDRLGSGWMPPVSRTTANALLAAQFTFIALVGAAMLLYGSVPRQLSVVGVLGGAMALLGVALAMGASRGLGSAMTASPLPRSGATLVTTGLYRYVRHPIYGGVIIFLAGAALLVASWPALILTVALIPFFLAKARYEESRLRMKFSGYRAYMGRVPHRLIPYIL